MGSTIGIVHAAGGWSPLLLPLTGAMLPGVDQNTMLKQFSWQQFLLAASAIGLVWYAAVFLFFYRGRKKKGRSGKSSEGFLDPRDVPVVKAGEPGLDASLSAEEELVGKPRLPEGMARIGSHQLLFAARNPEVAEWVDQGRRLGLVPDVIEELKDIFRVLEAEQGTKQDFMALFALVKAKFPGVSGTLEEKAINTYIRENVLFPISDAELDALWR